MVVRLFLTAFPELKEDKCHICREYQTQIIGPLREIVQLGTKEVAEILLREAYFLYTEGKYHDSEHFQRDTVNIYTLLFGSEYYNTLIGMNGLVLTYYALGRMKEAAILSEKGS
jgi:Tetratricopeptide repeat